MQTVHDLEAVLNAEEESEVPRECILVPVGLWPGAPCPQLLEAGFLFAVIAPQKTNIWGRKNSRNTDGVERAWASGQRQSRRLCVTSRPPETAWLSTSEEVWVFLLRPTAHFRVCFSKL